MLLFLIIKFITNSAGGCGHSSCSEETDEKGKTWRWCRLCLARYNPYTQEWEE